MDTESNGETRAFELIRDRWGVPHIFAERESDGFFGVGYVSAEDRRLQMELFRRRAMGRVAEVFGADWVESDRKFRIGGIPRYCSEAFANLPADLQTNLRAYAAGVNAYVAQNPERVRKRFAPLGIEPEPWTPADCIANWMAWAEMFDLFADDRMYPIYPEIDPDNTDSQLDELRAFQQLVASVGMEEAFRRRGRAADDEVAVVPESEMAKDKQVYAKLKAMKRQPGFTVRGISPQPFRFSHAWIVDGARSTTGKPILGSLPRTPVDNPAIFYEFHLKAGRYDVRGIGAPGAPNMLIGFNQHVSWGATGLGAGCTVNFLERLSPDRKGYEYKGEIKPFDRRLERIDVRDAEPVIQEVLTNPHGFVFNSLARLSKPGEAYVSHYKMVQDKGTSVRAMLQWMRRNWAEFVDAMEHYYSPGVNILYADADGNIAYQALVHVPLTRRSRRYILEGWTGEDEVLGRIPLAEMPHMVNPDSHTIYSGNHMPVGSWYPYDLGLASGTGEGPRAMRLRELLAGDRTFSVEDFETIHRDDVNPVVAALLPIARKVVEEEGPTDPIVLKVVGALKDWDLHYNASHLAYWTAMALCDAAPMAYRRTKLPLTMGAGISGLCHLARLLGARFSKDGATPKDEEVRQFLIAWLRLTGERLEASGHLLEGQTEPTPHVRSMPYQKSERICFPSANPGLDFVSGPLACGLVSTIWSQDDNAYSQIVDWSDVDSSRTILPPGISEDPESPFYLNQTDLWMAGTTHPAPLARDRVEALAVSQVTLPVTSYEGPDSSDEKVVEAVPAGATLVTAIPGSG